MNVHLSEIVSMVLEPLATAMKGSWEVISREDLLSSTTKYNKERDTKEMNNQVATIIDDILYKTINNSKGSIHQESDHHHVHVHHHPHNHLRNDQNSIPPEPATNSRMEKSETETSPFQMDGCQETSGDPVLIGYDFVKMYPSIDAETAAKDAHD